MAVDYNVEDHADSLGKILSKPKKSYKRGKQVSTTFVSAPPQNDYHTGGTYLDVQRLDGDEWTSVATDNDWSTKCRWAIGEEGEYRFTVTWDVPEDVATGEYRVVHSGSAREHDVSKPFSGMTRSFKVK